MSLEDGDEAAATAGAPAAPEGPAPDLGSAPTEVAADTAARLAERVVSQGLASRTDVAACLDGVDSMGDQATQELGAALLAGGLVSAAELAALTAADEAPGGLRPGTVFGAYVLESEIARGGMGVVFRARERGLERPVALKVIKREGASAEELRRLLREAQAAARVRHPGVIAIHATGDAPGPDGRVRPFIAMDLVEGPTLADVLTDVPLVERVRLLAGVAEAVGAAHAQGVVHRDLKPVNVLLADGGQRPVVTDFGLARVEDASTALTRSGQVLGTPPYMAPEQVRAQAELIGPPTDVWALGVMLFKALSGSLPFRGGSAQAVFEAILRAEHLRPPPVARPQVDLRTICMKSLSCDPLRRYADGTALAAELRRWLDHEPIVARAAGPLARAWRRVRRRPWRALAVASLLALTALGVGLGVKERSARRSRARLRDVAREAAAAEDWGAAQAACERALALGEDAELRALAGRCAERIRRAARVERLQRLLAPYRRLIEQLRPYFYAAAFDIRPRLVELRAACGELRDRLRADRGLSALAEGWVTLGRGWYYAGLPRRALQAFEAAVDRDPRAPQPRVYLARLCLRESMSGELAYRGGAGRGEATKRRWLERGRVHLAAPVRRSVGAPPIERLLLRAYKALLARERDQALTLCREALQQHRSELGVEEFGLVAAFLSRPVAAIKTLDQVLTYRPHHPWALVRRGLNYRELGDTARARADLDRALELSPELVPALLARALMLGEAGDAAAGLSTIDRALALDPAPRNRLMRAMLLIDADRLDEARAELDRIIAADPREAGAWLYRGLLRCRRDDLRGALADLDEALRRDDGDPRAWLQRGIVHGRLGHARRAEADLSRAVTLAPDDPDLYYNRAVARQQVNPEGALADVAEVLRRTPRDARTLALRARIELGRGALERALADAAQALAISPDHVRAGDALAATVVRVGQRARAHRAAGRLDAALADHDRAIAALAGVRPALESQLMHQLLDRAEVQLRRKRAAPARADLEQALSVADGWTTLSTLRRLMIAQALSARARLRPGAELDAALTDLGRALQVVSPPAADDAELRAACRQVLTERARRLRGAARWEPARADYDRVLAMAPEDLRCRHERAGVREALGDLDGAEADYREAVRRQPTLWQSWAMLGQLLAGRGRTAQAVEALRRALPHTPAPARPPIQALLDRLGSK